MGVGEVSLRRVEEWEGNVQMEMPGSRKCGEVRSRQQAWAAAAGRHVGGGGMAAEAESTQGLRKEHS